MRFSTRGSFGYNGATGNAMVQGIGGKGIEFNVNNNTFGSGTAGLLTLNGFFGLGSGITSALIGNAGLVVNQTNVSGNGDIFTASTSGMTKFIINNGGKVGFATNVPCYALNV